MLRCFSIVANGGSTSDRTFINLNVSADGNGNYGAGAGFTFKF